jgi:hypothetical protein
MGHCCSKPTRVRACETGRSDHLCVCLSVGATAHTHPSTRMTPPLAVNATLQPLLNCGVAQQSNRHPDPSWIMCNAPHEDSAQVLPQAWQGQRCVVRDMVGACHLLPVFSFCGQIEGVGLHSSTARHRCGGDISLISFRKA